jgi:hypothetical protein
MAINIPVYWDLTGHCVVDACQCFQRPRYFHLQSIRVSQTWQRCKQIRARDSRRRSPERTNQIKETNLPLKQAHQRQVRLFLSSDLSTLSLASQSHYFSYLSLLRQGPPYSSTHHLTPIDSLRTPNPAVPSIYARPLPTLGSTVHPGAGSSASFKTLVLIYQITTGHILEGIN